MQNLTKTKSVMFLAGLAGSCLLATVVFANPSMLPEHPGHPMKPLKDPVNGQSLANDPGRENFTGQDALDAAIKEGNQDMNLQSRSSLLKEEMPEEQSEMAGKEQMHNRNPENIKPD
jgi:hypothetical protein